MTSPDRDDADSSSDAPIPSGSLRSRRSELDTDLHSASSHSRRRRPGTGSGGDPQIRPLTKSLHSGQREQRRKEHAQRHFAKGIVQYDDTDCESCGDDEDELGDHDFDHHSTYDDEDDDDDDDCSSFCEPTDSCVANNRYLCRGMSIEICELHDVSEFDDQVAEPLEAVESLSLM